MNAPGLLLLPVSWLYGLIVWLRNRCYDARLFRVEGAGVPVISVGNLTAGGTGKTPFVEYLVNRLQTADRRIAVLSRGYKRTTRGTVVVSDGRSVAATADRAGDEPVQIARKFPGAVVIADERRTRSARIAVDRFHCDVIVLDDGFQHRAIGRDLDIVMMNAGESLVRMPMLPAGFRREQLAALRRAGLLVVSLSEGLAGGQAAGPAAGRDDVSRYASAPEVTMRLKPDCVIHAFRGEALPLERVRGAAVVAFCGIGNPAGFERTLIEMGATVLGSLTFPDHHRFTQEDLEKIRGLFESSGAAMILTTEKDAVRLSTREGESCLGSLPLYYVGIKAEIVEGEAVLRSLVDSVLARPDVRTEARPTKISKQT